MKAPAFQFYPGDFILSTNDMTSEEVGGYMRLLCHQWANTGLPDNLKKIEGIARISGESLETVLEKFHLYPDGKLKNNRLEKVREEQDLYREKKSKAGKAGADAKYGKQVANGKQSDANAIANGKQKVSQTNSPSSSTSSSVLLEKEPKSEVSFLQMFEACQKIYPGTKRGSATEFADLEKKCKKEFSPSFFRALYHGINLKVKTNKELDRAGQFVPEWPHLKTYLNQRRWEEQTEVKAQAQPFKEPTAFENLAEKDDYWGGRNPNFKPTKAVA